VVLSLHTPNLLVGASMAEFHIQSCPPFSNKYRAMRSGGTRLNNLNSKGELYGE
jgi:hypothetical protein